MKKVITYGTYDLLHQGHINLLKRAKALGDYLIVGVTNDNFDRDRGKLNVHNNVLERVDAVYIATPHLSHYELCKEAILHHKHVLCETPLLPILKLMGLEYTDVHFYSKMKNGIDEYTLRYEIQEFISCIFNHRFSTSRLRRRESIAMADIMQQFGERKNFMEI